MFYYKFVTNLPEFQNDLQDTLNSFAQYAAESCEGTELSLMQSICGESVRTVCACGDLKEENVFEPTSSEPLYLKRARKRAAKKLLYVVLSKVTGVNLPWGSLTGIRPTKIAYEFHDLDAVRREFFVSDEKIRLLEQITEAQRGLRVIDDACADIYVNIPFCISRCSYCSFISAIIGQKRKLIMPYTEALCRELESLGEIGEKYKIRSVYVGGGTPTSFSERELDRILACFDGMKVGEFTVEAGRPDSVTREKLDCFKAHGVTRISINPQSFNQKTLDLVGRKHTVEDFYNAFSLAREYDFDINADLIAALPGEIAEDFAYSVDRITELSPENVTVHTLAIKKSSDMRNNEYDNTCDEAAQMVKYANNVLTESGYSPYYLYRQKYMSGNLENVGYSKPGKACVYNIDNMEECCSVIAFGAGAVSKRIFAGGGRIERYSNAKNIEEYLNRIDEYIERKRDFFLKD